MSESKYIRNAEGHFVCPHCTKTCEKQNTMYYHMKTHTLEHKYTCTQCEDQPKFMQKSSYYHHLATAHPTNPHPDASEKNPYAGVQFTCPSCDHHSHTKANILIHYARNHCKTWIPTFDKHTRACTGCKSTFESASAYLYHAVKCFTVPDDQKDTLSRIK